MTLTQRQRVEALYKAVGLQFDGDWEAWPLPLLEKIAAAGMIKPREKKCRDCGASWTAPVPYCPECRGLPTGCARSESKRITDQQIQLWADRHDISGNMTFICAAFDDARTLEGKGRPLPEAQK